MQNMSGFLSEIISDNRERLEARKRNLPIEALKKGISVERQAGVFSESLSKNGISIIAEVKRASPSKGMLRPDLDVAEVVASYERGGASAISVLTEEKYFSGSLGDLILARKSCGLPLLRKDFIVDTYQVWEAAAAGADAVLLIAAALSGDYLIELMAEVESAGLEALVEVHDLEDLVTATGAGASIIGINNRDLRTFEVDLRTCLDLKDKVPSGVISVAESGIKGKSDVVMVEGAGFDAILVGETLMKSKDPEDMLRILLSK